MIMTNPCHIVVIKPLSSSIAILALLAFFCLCFVFRLYFIAMPAAGLFKQIKVELI